VRRCLAHSAWDAVNPTVVEHCGPRMSGRSVPVDLPVNPISRTKRRMLQVKTQKIGSVWRYGFAGRLVNPKAVRHRGSARRANSCPTYLVWATPMLRRCALPFAGHV
jgi:hypothetical protein